MSGVATGTGCQGEGGKVAGQYTSYSWIIIFSFGVEKSGPHEDDVRFPRVSFATVIIVRCQNRKVRVSSRSASQSLSVSKPSL